VFLGRITRDGTSSAGKIRIGYRGDSHWGLY
jgi:hypothetical protein